MTTSTPARPERTASKEQLAIVDAMKAGRRVKAPAFAGAAKSTTGRMVMRAVAPKKVLYVAYNASMAADMRRSVAGYRNVTVSTGHALAMKDVGHTFGSRIETRTYAIRGAIEQRFRARLMRLSSEPAKAADAVLGTVLNYQNSASAEISVDHVPEDINIIGSPRAVAEVAREVFAAMTDVDDTFPLTHDTYFKFWQSEVKPRLDERFDVIIFDEAQDANPVMLAVLEDQNCAKLVIYDTHQSLYAFRNAVNAGESLTTGYELLSLTQSFRFGPEIAALANAILALKREPRTLRGTPSIPTRVVTVAPEGSVPNLVLARTNAGVFEEALRLVNAGYTVDVIGGIDELLGMVLGAHELNVHGRSTHSAFKFFRNWDALVEASEGPRGNEYAPWVRIVSNHGNLLPEMCARIRDGVGGADAVRLSTVHKSKGLEADHVKLGDDFIPFCTFDPKRKKIVFRPDEANVFYVAITRAKLLLELGPDFEAKFESALATGYRLFGFPPAPTIAQLLSCGVE
jgi:hypothetical protein